MIHEELIYQFATTDDEVEAYEIMILLVAYYLQIYDEEAERFAADNDVDISLPGDGVRNDYAMYIADLLVGMRKRVKEQEKRLSGLDQAAFLIAMHDYVSENYQTIDRSETSNARQLGQLHVVSEVQASSSAVKVYKRWRAHPDCCDICRALDGVIVPIDDPFLINGQVVELSNGKEFIYNYIDRGVAIAHPNDRCWIEFIIEF